MRVAMLHLDLPPETKGGVAHQVARLGDALAARGHDVVVHSLSPAPPGAAYAVERLGRRPAPSVGKLERLLTVPVRFAARSFAGADVVHAHGDSHLLVRRRVPVVRTFYGSARAEARHATRLRRRASQTLLVGAERVARRLATVTVGISEATVHDVGPLDSVVPCGVDRERFRPGLEAERPVVLFVGTIDGRKRGRLVVDAFRDVVRPAVPDAELWLVADKPVAGDGIRSFGRVDDAALAGLYQQAWCFVLASTYEGFGVPYLEAMASGTPVVATPNAGALELLGPGGGCVVDDADVGPTIVRLLTDASWRHALGAEGRARSEAYGWDAVAARYEAVYALARTRVAGP